jgi:hypothetical protein
MSHLLQSISQWIALAALLLLLIALYHKDQLPVPAYYQSDRLTDPIQRPISSNPFWIEQSGQRYQITPLFDYALEGVIVSYHDADSITDIWHHEKWRDYINIRDLCVIWGENVRSGVYQDMKFENDSWTCWAYWPDRQTGERFSMTQLSNNHLLVDNEVVKRSLMSAQLGDHVRITGQLASYENSANNFKRGTSTRRDDTGNGACETLYVTSFETIKKANTRWRSLFRFAKWTLGISLGLFVILFAITPIRKPVIR